MLFEKLSNAGGKGQLLVAKVMGSVMREEPEWCQNDVGTCQRVREMRLACVGRCLKVAWHDLCSSGCMCCR